MANALYQKGVQKFLEGGIAWLTDTIKLVPVTSGYVFSQTHANLSDVPSGNRVATPVALGSKTSTNGTADAADVTFPLVPSGSTIQAYVVYKDTGTEATSSLIAYIDTSPDGTLPKLTNGGDIVAVFDNGTNKIFTL